MSKQKETNLRKYRHSNICTENVSIFLNQRNRTHYNLLVLHGADVSCCRDCVRTILHKTHINAPNQNENKVNTVIKIINTKIDK